MKWTSEVPQEDGWYWLKANHFYQCVLFEYHTPKRGGPTILVCGTEADFHMHDFSNAQWAGPIPEPE